MGVRPQLEHYIQFAAFCCSQALMPQALYSSKKLRAHRCSIRSSRLCRVSSSPSVISLDTANLRQSGLNSSRVIRPSAVIPGNALACAHLRQLPNNRAKLYQLQRT